MTAGGEFGNLIRRVVVPRMQLIPGTARQGHRQSHAGIAPLRVRSRPRVRTAAGGNAVPQSGARRRPPTRQHPRRRLRTHHRRAPNDMQRCLLERARRRCPYRRARRRTRRLASPRPRHGGDRPAGPHGHVGRPRHAEDPRPAADLHARETDSIECLGAQRCSRAYLRRWMGRRSARLMTDLPKRSIVSSTCARLSPGKPTCTHVTPSAASFSRPDR